MSAPKPIAGHIPKYPYRQRRCPCRICQSTRRPLACSISIQIDANDMRPFPAHAGGRLADAAARADNDDDMALFFRWHTLQLRLFKRSQYSMSNASAASLDMC